MNSYGAKYNFIKILAFTLIFFLNQTLANKAETLNVAPNLMFVVVLCASLIENSLSNIYYALGFGLLFDFFNGKIMGVHVILFLLLSYILSEIYHTYFENMISVKTLLAVLGCFLYSLLFAVFFGLRGAGFISVLIRISLIEFIYNALLSIAVIFIYTKIINIRKSAWRVR